MTGDSLRLSVSNVTKSYGSTRALAGVSMDVRAGEVLAVLGENGAGKSTLMGVLSGTVTPDGGSMRLDGAAHTPTSPGDAMAAGVAIVHQELSLCPHLTAAENILLGREPTQWGLLSAKRARAKASEVLRELGADVPVDVPVGTLSPAARQLIEIARAISQSAVKVLILDEPTSSLAAGDVEKLFDAVRRLSKRGVSVLYISHFLEEAQAIADRYVVLRDGASVDDGPMADTPLEHIVEKMVGRPVDELFSHTPSEPGDVVLELDGVAGDALPLEAALTLRKGEALGIAGLVGAGRTELLRAVFGLDAVRRGTVRVKAYVGPASPTERWAQGVGLLSEDRKGEGLALSMSIADNITLSKLGAVGKLGFVAAAEQHERAQHWIDELGIRCQQPEQPVGALSGGNQQKVALARLLQHDVDVLLLDEPTRGVDVGAKATIYQRIDRLRQDGRAILMVSSYLPELLGTCDRIAVMARGRLGRAKPTNKWTAEAIMMEATGAADSTKAQAS